MYRRADDI
jgi:hypothetical protein